MRDVIGGLDLSFAGLGMVSVPSDWDLDWKRVQFKSLAAKLKNDASITDQIRRLRMLAVDVRTFCIRTRMTRIWIEQQPGYVKPEQTASYRKNAMLLAFVLDELVNEVRIEPKLISESTARSFMLGKLPPKDRKAHLVQALKAAGDPFQWDDERDAFTCANWGLHELGAPCLKNLLWNPEAEAKPKRGRKAKVAA